MPTATPTRPSAPLWTPAANTSHRSAGHSRHHGRRGFTVDALDMFCGFGGSSQGIHAAGATVRLAANHKQLAIDVHASNFPDADHLRADLSDPDSADYIDPINLPPARFLWASPSCKFHSLANAKKLYAQGPTLFEDPEFDQAQYANSERSRVTMVCPLRYARRHKPEIVVVENVVECAKWGPNRDGSTFRWWLHEWQKAGYEYRILFFNSQHFLPCPQSRDRMYVVFWRRGNRAPDLDYKPTAYCMSDRCGGAIVQAYQSWKDRTRAWPLPEWGKYRTQYIYRCEECRQPVEPAAMPAYTAIDWTRLGPAIGERSTVGLDPLADATMERIRRGLAKFRHGPPIVIPAKGTWGVDKSVLDPMPTQTSQQERALVSMLIRNNGDMSEAKYRAHHAGVPLGAITSSPTQAVVTKGVVIPTAGNTFERAGQTRARDLADQLFTQHTTQAFGFAHMPFVSEMRGDVTQHRPGDHRAVTDALSGVTAGGFHHGLASLPFLLSGQPNDSSRALVEQMFTLVATGRGNALVSPAMFQKINGSPGQTSWHHTDDPLNTVTGRDTHGLVILPWVEQWQADPVAVTEQFAALTTHLSHSLASIEADLMPISDDELDSVRFRMLDPDPELRRAMAFDDTYILLGNKTQMTEGLGNAVTPPVASWVTERCLATLDPDLSRSAA